MWNVGDEARGVKQLHGKCISCDRPLNVVRPEHKLGELPMHDNSIATTSRPHGPGWEAFSNRALAAGCGEVDITNKTRCESLLSSSSFCTTAQNVKGSCAGEAHRLPHERTLTKISSRLPGQQRVGRLAGAAVWEQIAAPVQTQLERKILLLLL